MAIEAKVNEDCKWQMVTACGGLQFTKLGFRPVPDHEEDSARDNPFLTVRDIKPAKVEKAKSGKPKTEVPADVDPETVEMLKGNVGQVGAAIRQIDDVELLQLIHDLDERKGVKDAATARMAELKDGPAELKDGPDEGGD